MTRSNVGLLSDRAALEALDSQPVDARAPVDTYTIRDTVFTSM